MRIGFNVDSSGWPLVRTHAAGDVDDHTLKAFMGEMSALSARKEPWGNVIDLSDLGMMTGAQRRRYAEYLKATCEDHKKYCVAVGVVAPSVLVRGIVTAISWLHPWPHPTKACATTGEAESFVRERLGAAGVRV